MNDILAMDDDYKVSSELYEEHAYGTNLKPHSAPNNVVSVFQFQINTKQSAIDNDGDLVVQRKSCIETVQKIEIEHSTSTILNLVGLQVWRGALLLADWLIYNQDNLPERRSILELGSGVGLTSIVASMYRPVICTDINEGGILELIKSNAKRNSSLSKFPIKVMELNFLKDLSDELEKELQQVEVVIAADVVYDDSITDAFVNVIKSLLSLAKRTIYVALEKRYVFTITDCDSVAPCYEYFLECINKLNNARLEEIDLSFPQYFQYDRAKELVLWKISNC